MKKTWLILILITFCFSVNAQSIVRPNVDATTTENQERLGILASAVNAPQVNINNFANSADSYNQVLIQQVGFENRANVQTRSSASNIEVTQNGNFNSLDINITAPEIKESIIQNGNNNRVLDNIYYSNTPVELNLIQNGDNLTLNRIGNNSLTNRLKLIQQGSQKTITIISN